MDEDRNVTEDDYAALPVRVITVNQVVAWNMGRYRRAMRMTQEGLACHLGWNTQQVSDAERSWKSGRTREFDAQLLTAIAIALGVPVIALLIPPAADGDGERYEIPLPDGGTLDMAAYMAEAVSPDTDGEGPAVGSYRERYHDAAHRYLPPEVAAVAGRWTRATWSPAVVADAAAELRDMQHDLAAYAKVLGSWAAQMEGDTDGVKP
jgi:transcriptional regulator with XRE-family HTH domain